MIIVLNGPLGIGKSTFAEALSESIDQCVMLDGDHLVAVNPPPPDELELLHSTIALLVAHHRKFGYRHFLINHLWTSPHDLEDLRHRLTEIEPGAEIRFFLLTLPFDENLRRIQHRAGGRAINDLHLELQTLARERRVLEESRSGELGEPFDVARTPPELVTSMLGVLGHLR